MAMTGVNPPSSAAAARNYEVNQSLKRSVQAAFDGTAPSPLRSLTVVALYLRKGLNAAFFVFMILRVHNGRLFYNTSMASQSF